MPLPDDYIAALERLGRVFETYAAKTGSAAVLVGGAAAAIYTDGLFPSGDFDIVAAQDEAFDAAMLAHDFIKEDRAGHLLVGYYHLDHPAYGFQQVSGALFEGRSERSRLTRVEVTGDSTIILPAIEDLIADRLGQHAVATGTEDSRLRQARTLFQMAEQIDTAYLVRRIGEEGGDPALLGLPGADAGSQV